LQQGYIYVGPNAYSAHDIPGPMCYMRLKDISWPRLGGMLYAHFGTYKNMLIASNID